MKRQDFAIVAFATVFGLASPAASLAQGRGGTPVGSAESRGGGGGGVQRWRRRWRRPAGRREFRRQQLGWRVSILELTVGVDAERTVHEPVLHPAQPVG